MKTSKENSNGKEAIQFAACSPFLSRFRRCPARNCYSVYYGIGMKVNFRNERGTYTMMLVYVYKTHKPADKETFPPVAH